MCIPLTKRKSDPATQNPPAEMASLLVAPSDMEGAAAEPGVLLTNLRRAKVPAIPLARAAGIAAAESARAAAAAAEGGGGRASNPRRPPRGQSL